jgi:hypothetical protein
MVRKYINVARIITILDGSQLLYIRRHSEIAVVSGQFILIPGPALESNYRFLALIGRRGVREHVVDLIRVGLAFSQILVK